MLVRIRDEYRMVKECLLKLYDSSIHYGMKKAMISNNVRNEMQDSLLELKNENSKLRKEIAACE